MKLRNILSFMKKGGFANLWDDLLTEGRLVATTDEIMARSGSTRASVHVAVAEAQRRGRLYSPTRGLYVIVPAEYRKWGAPPVEWFIDDLCRHLNRRYYVSFLSAAQHYGAAHQAPQEFQVVVDRPVAGRLDRPHRIKFFAASKIEDHATTRASSPGGVFVVATPETLALDLADFPKRAGGLSNVATILSDLRLQPSDLLAAAQLRRRSTVRRLGWLLEQIDVSFDTEPLRRLAHPSEGRPTKLDNRGRWGGPVDDRWGLLVNSPVEPDT
jgi:predicted transcriptional regulator of viral defense system